MNTTQATPAIIYRAARDEGKGTRDACRIVLDAYPMIDFDEVVEMSWIIETGKPAPKWENEDGSPTQAALDFSRGQDLKNEHA